MTNKNRVELKADGEVWETVIDFREIDKEGISLEELLCYL